MARFLLISLLGFSLIFSFLIFGKEIFNRYFPFQAAVIEPISKEEEEEIEPEIEKEEILSESEKIALSERIDELEERVDFLSQQLANLIEKPQKIEEAPEIEEITEIEETEKEEIEEEEIKEEEIGQEIGQKPCEIISGSQPGQNKVIINELAWMGTINSANDEWIELKNISGAKINLAGWQILNKDKKIKIFFSIRDVIPLNGFYLLERTDDDSVPQIKADLIYTGALKNSDEALYLFDENCQLQDLVLANPNWPAGDNSSKRTMERKSDLGWQTSQDPGGTPKRENSSGYLPLPPIEAGLPVGPEPTYPKILISEVKIAEKIGDKNIFVELYNPNDFEINLTDWYIFRNDSSFITKTLLEREKIPPKGYFLIARKGSIWENQANVLFDDQTLNEDDKITLKNPKGEVVDEISWSQIPSGFSLGRKWSGENYGDFGIQEPTPKGQNVSPFPSEDITPPNRFNGQPTGTLSSRTTETNISLETDEMADCKYSTVPEMDYDSMIDFSITGGTSHSVLITDLADGNTYTYYVKCVDTVGNKNSNDFVITFNIAPSVSLLDVVINEIAWMGTKDSANDEWIELYNNTASIIDIVGWRLVSSDGTPNITFSASNAVTTIISSPRILPHRKNK